MVAYDLMGIKPPRRKVTPKKPRRQIDMRVHYSARQFQGRSSGRHFQAAIFNVYKYFRRESLNGGPLRDIKQVTRRVCDALNISPFLVTKVLKKARNGEQFVTPAKARVMKRRKRNINDFTKAAIRGLIYESHTKRAPMTVKDLLLKIRERDIDFTGGVETLRKVLHDLGFSYRKRNGVRYLLEQPRIVQLRRNFLRKFRDLHLEGKKLRVYLDETWVFRRGSDKSKGWQDDDIRSCPTRHSDSGGRYVVIHAGSKHEFVPGAGKVFPTKEKPLPGEDYHGDMDGGIMKRWFTGQLLPGLSMPSAIIMDNAPYHTCQASQRVHDSWMYYGASFDDDM